MNTIAPRLMKVVYFDEESASDLLDMTAGGKTNTESSHVQERANEAHAKMVASLTAKLSWLPFVGVSGEVGAGAGASHASQSILSKTLSNTILTDYLRDFEDDAHVHRLDGLDVRAVLNSMAWMKMYTPYLSVMRDSEAPIDPTKLDDALARAKGYYELVGSKSGADVCVLRFNINAFRNNYGLIDLARMDLIFHAIKVGRTTLANLSMAAEMGTSVIEIPKSVDELLDGDGDGDGDDDGDGSAAGDAMSSGDVQATLDVYDVILAGVQHEG